ncbi:MAG: hypothetical protein O2956_14705 [Gemmatimonadetes bacterium]|nr:hypothetical protein [Gemmatimonadota bacterium]
MRSSAQMVAVLVVLLAPASAEAQAGGEWFWGGDGGRYEVHEDARTGVSAALRAGLRWGVVGFQLSATRGFGDDSFTAVEPGVLLRLGPSSAPVYLILGGGGGFLDENAAAFSYFGQVGVGAGVGGGRELQALVRRGSHSGSGNSGTFPGPHTFSLGFVRAF